MGRHSSTMPRHELAVWLWVVIYFLAGGTAALIGMLVAR